MSEQQTNKPTPTKGNIKFNETLTAVYGNDRFGKGSYVSRSLSQEDIDGLVTAIRSMVPGSAILMKNTSKFTSNGNALAFLEVLPPNPKKPAEQPESEL